MNVPSHLKLESDGILTGIINAFSRIEAKDRRVERVFIPRDKFHKLAMGFHGFNYSNPFRDFAGYEQGLVNNPQLMQRIEQTPLRKSKVGELFGASVFLGDPDTFEVHSENLNPSGYIMPYPYGMPQQIPPNVLIEKVECVPAFLIKLRSNMTIIVKSRSNPIAGISNSEAIAIETLREMITEEEYRRYIKHGFILVKGHSGDVYQVFRMASHTKVWRSGTVVEEVCVRIQDVKVPPTDNVIAFKTIIEASEAEFKKLGNVYKLSGE
jgi:hypothetical protein